MIASDLHGSGYYCEMLFKKYEEGGYDKLLLLGDLLYHGPRNDLPKGYRPQAVISMLNEHSKDIIWIEGNCDAAVDQMVLDIPMVRDFMIIVWNDQLIYATHGHKFGEFHPITKEDHLMLCGHTHVPKCRFFDHYVYLNPGSVSLPKEGFENSYMTMEGDTLTWHGLLTDKIHRTESLDQLILEMHQLADKTDH